MADTPPPPLTIPADAEAERLTFGMTRAMMRADFQRLLDLTDRGSWAKRLYWFLLPSYQAMFLYRLYRYMYLNNWTNSSRLLFLFSRYLTGVDISPETSIGPGCLIGHGFGVILCGKIGARFSIYGQGGTGGGLSEGDVGGGPGLPVIGDDVVFGVRAMALGAIKIGNRVKFAPGAFAACDIPDDAMVLSMPSKVIKIRIGASASTANASNKRVAS